MQNRLGFLVGLCVSACATAAPTLDGMVTLAKALQKSAQEQKRHLTLDTFLEAVGNTHPELRQHYLLVHDSRSRQKSSYEFPRVIAYSPDGRFSLAFNADPKLRGYDEIEMFDFGPQARPSPHPALGEAYRPEGFRFQRIVFTKTGPDPKPVNEPLCLGCHGKNPRPNWESYNIWEGVYPSRDTVAIGKKYYLGYETEDHAGFDLFYTRQAGRGRYTFLQRLEEQFLVNAPKQGAPFSRVAPSDYTQLVGYLNYRRLAHLLLQSPDFAKYKYAIFGALYDCDAYDAFFPTPLETEHSVEWYQDDTEKSFRADANHFLLEGDHRAMGKLRYVMEGRGLSMSQWSLSFRRSPYAFVTPGGMPEGFLTAVIMEYDKSLEPYRIANLVAGEGYGDYGVTTAFSQEWTGSMKTQTAAVCGDLQKMSRKALGEK